MSTQAPNLNLDAQADHLHRSQEILERLLNFRRPYDASRDEFYRHFVGRAYQKFYPDGKTRRSSTFVPQPFANVTFTKAAIMGDLFGFLPPFETLPRGARDEQASMSMQRVLELQTQEAGLSSNFAKFLGGLLVYGFQAWRVDWDWEYDIVLDTEVVAAKNPDGSVMMNPMMPDQPQLQRVQVPKKVPRNRPKYTVMDVYDCLIDPDRTFVAVLFDKTLPQMLREQENYKESQGVTLYNEDSLAKLQDHVAGRGLKGREELIHMAELWDVLEGTFTLFTAQEDHDTIGHKDLRLTNRVGASYQGFRRGHADAPALVLRQGLNPYAHKHVPILWANYTELPGEVYGMGVIEPSWASVESLNRFIDLITDNWVMGVNQRLVINGDRDIDADEIQKNNLPGGVMVANGVPQNNIWPLPVHTPSAGDYAILPLFQQMIETASNVSDPFQRGVGSTKGNKTATGIQSVIQQSSVGRSEVNRYLADEILQPTLSMHAQLVQQYGPDEMEIRITDNMPVIPKVKSRFLTIKNSDLLGNFDFRIVGANYMENRFVAQRNAQGMFQLATTMFPDYVKPVSALNEMFRIHRIAYPGRFIYTEEEVAAMQQQKEQAELQKQLQMQALGLTPEAQREGSQIRSENRKEARGRRSTFEGNDPTSSATRSQAQNAGRNAMGVSEPGQRELPL